ncbi:helix-turn-helix domain-containing protein [Gorillibacterium sp. sgz5001074]|uniref:helix-turn-helix domain-containing protein n=1 Tax=Gorillibacterium sp. sgz5001074 TaxID=3446695 RepID=UPI003F67A4B7
MRRMSMIFRFLITNKKTRLILLMTLLVSSSILSVGLFSYSQYKKALDTDLNTPNVELLQINLDVTNRAIREADAKGVDAAFRESVQSFLRPDGLDAGGRTELQAYLKTMATKPDLHSIAVVRLSDQAILSSEFGYVPKGGQAPDTSWTAWLDEVKSKPLLVKRRMYGAAGAPGQTELLTLVRPVVRNGQVAGAVMVNMDYDRLFSKIYTHLSSYQYQYVYNLEGELIYPKLRGPIPLDEMQNVIRMLDVRPFDYVKVAGQEYMANQTFSNVTGWRMISLVPMEQLLKNVRVARDTMLLFALVSVLVGCSAIYFYNYAAFRPLKRINRLLASGQKHAKSGDLYDLEPAIGKLVGDFQNKSLLAERTLPELRAKYLQDVLSRSIGSQEIRIKWEQYFREWSEGPLAMLAVSVDRYGHWAADLPEEDRMLLKYALNNVLLETLEHSWRVASLHMEKDSWAVLVQPKEELSEAWGTRLREDARLVVERLREYLSVSVSVGIGTERPDILQAAGSYSEATEALSYRLYEGYGQVRDFGSIEQDHEEGYTFGGEAWIAGILNGLPTAGRETAEAWIGRWAQETRENPLSPHRVYRTVDDLLEELLRFMRRHNLTPPPELADYTRHRVTTMELGEVEELLARLVGYITEELGKRKLTKEYQLVQTMIRYMQEHLSENIGLQDVADQVNLGISSVSNIFKEETGSTVYDYLTGLRIDRACELLMNTPLKLAEIAQQVGYTNENSFIRAFRKIKSVTPGKFREFNKSSNGYADPPKPRQSSVSDDSAED